MLYLFEKILFIPSAIFIVFFIGLIFGLFHLPPTEQVSQVIAMLLNSETREKVIVQSTYLRNVEFTIPIKDTYIYMEGKQLDIKGNGLVGYEPSEVSKGYTLINGMEKNDYIVKLIDIKGNTVHKWVVPYCKYYTCDDIANKQTIEWVNEIGGSVLYPNGDIVLSHQYAGLMKLDKDSNVIWKTNLRAHHLLYRDKEGNIWTPGVKTGQAQYKIGKHILIIKDPEYIFKVSPDGQLLEEYNIIDILINSDMKGLMVDLFNRFDEEKTDGSLVGNIIGEKLTHLNDVDIVEDPEVYALAGYEKGDILFSLNTLNAIVLLDPKTKKVKWLSVTPFLRQHDPDITKDGNIMVFDNKGGGNKAFFERKSRVLSFNPFNNKTTIHFEKDKEDLFYSFNRGNQQVLPNGNLLITESTRGHVFEINKEGKVVWEYFDIWDKDYISFISQAIRYPEEYVKFLDKK